MKALVAAGIALWTTALPVGAQQKHPSAAVALVRQLYTDFACEAVVDEPECDPHHQFVDQPRAMLSKYFDDRLVQLWLADRQCAARSHEICKLDFSPIWNSQDPAGTTVRIRSTNNADVVNVEVYHGPSSAKAVLHYTLAKTPAGLRIRDISRGKEWSLVSLLSQTP